MKTSLQRFVTLVLAMCMGGIAVGQILSQSDLRRLYGSRWVVLPFPDSRITPGSIVSIKKSQVAWESDLKSCGAPKDVLAVNSSNSGKVTLNGAGEYGANAVIALKGVEIGPDFKRVKKTTLTADQHGPEGLDRIVLGTWFNDPATKLSKECSDFLSAKDVFIVQEAYRVSKGTYTLLGDNNAKLELKGLNLGILKLSASASAKTTTDGSLAFEQPVYTAIRRLKRFSDGSLKTLGDPGAEKTDDVTVRQLLYGAAK